MFNKKNDPLVESVKAVMKENEFRRQAEAALNEELGISSKKALPHEYHTQYDALLEAKVVDAEDREVKRGKSTAGKVGIATGKFADKVREKAKRALDRFHTEMEPKDKRPPSMEEDVHPNQKVIAKQDGNAKSISRKDLRILRIKDKSGVKIDEQDINPADLPKLSPGLQGRIVKDPPAPTPTPAPKKMEEARLLGVAQRRAVEASLKAKGTTDNPKFRPNPPGEQGEQRPSTSATEGIYKSLDRRRITKKRQGQDMAESVIAEIRENLEANLMAIHESGDDELFENYVNSLTEEELDILGLSEERDGNEIGQKDVFIPKPALMRGPDTPKTQASADSQKMLGEEPSKIEDSAGTNYKSAAEPLSPPGSISPVEKAAANRPKDGTTFGAQNLSKTTDETGQGGYSPSQIPKTPASATQPPAAPAQAAKKPNSTAPAAQARPAQTAAPRPQASTAASPSSPFGDTTSGGNLSSGGRDAGYRTPSSVAAAKERGAARQAARPQAARPQAARPARSAPAGRDPFTMSEQVKPNDNRSLQIKESLESFVRNRFLKG
jgi:hypothetical protein